MTSQPPATGGGQRLGGWVGNLRGWIHAENVMRLSPDCFDILSVISMDQAHLMGLIIDYTLDRGILEV